MTFPQRSGRPEKSPGALRASGSLGPGRELWRLAAEGASEGVGEAPRRAFKRGGPLGRRRRRKPPLRPPGEPACSEAEGRRTATARGSRSESGAMQAQPPLHGGYFHPVLRSWQATAAALHARHLVYPIFVS